MAEINNNLTLFEIKKSINTCNKQQNCEKEPIYQSLKEDSKLKAVKSNHDEENLESIPIINQIIGSLNFY